MSYEKLFSPVHLPFIPPENPLQLANTIRGNPSLLKSLIACAVLYDESGNQTCPVNIIQYV